MSASQQSGDAERTPLWRAFGSYTAARAGLFALFAVLTYLAGVRGVIVLVIALVLSSVMSYFFLARQRATFALAVHAHAERRQHRVSARTAREDAIADEMARHQQEQSRELG